MRLHSESNPALNTVTAYGQDYIEINRITFRHAIYFAPDGEIHEWSVHRTADITEHELRKVAGLPETIPLDPMALLDGRPPQKPDDAPEVLLIGTGLHQRFLPTSVTQALLSIGVGVEVMSTEAAARTYNILMAEGRRVVVALLPNKETE